MGDRILDKLFYILALAPISCFGQNTKANITYIKYGTSFGMCEGYCLYEVKFDPKKTVRYSKAWGQKAGKDLPDKRDTLKVKTKS